jgi:acyl-homoserine lactone acylase PvdQ
MVSAQDSQQQKRWKDRAARTTIIRDNWGVPHVYGKTDADAVFGLMYAQCEDDFPRVELNYIEKLGRLAELNGVKDLWNDLYLRMIIDSSDAIADYQKSPAWLKELLQAWSDGIEYYLYTHPDVRPRLLRRFPAWYPLLWTDGSIGAINTGDVSAEDVRQFYESGAGKMASDPSWELGKKRDLRSGISEAGSGIAASIDIPASALNNNQTNPYNFQNPKSDFPLHPKELSGSNGFAIAPSKSASGKAMLYINPHVTFYFRPEVQMSSEQGLQAYGAVTWGQFFIYQGFNAEGGWMHTSSNADVADEYLEKVVEQGGKKFYAYNNGLKPLKQRNITIRFRKGDSLLSRTFTAYATHHGPVMASRKDGWVSVRHYNRALNSLVQSWQRTKTKSFADYQKVMDLKGNTSNNTVYADKEGNIAYWHGNYMPKRDKRYDWSKPVDGTVLSTEYKGLHDVKETVHIYNPSNGWIQNCNSTPFTAAGVASPNKENYPAYMAPDGENFRGVNAVRVLDKAGKLSMDDLIKAGYDTYLPAFEVLVPALIRAFDKNVPEGNLLYQEIHGAIQTLKQWDYHASASSVATTLAIEWGQKLNPAITKVYINPGEADQVTATKQFAERAGYDDLLLAFRGVVMDLKERFGTWEVPWGEINRYQRLTGQYRETYDDAKPSLPVPFAASTWGCLPAYASRRMEGTRKRYGFGGNSFICVVEFGERVRAKSLLAGGVNNNPSSPHFNDQAEMYTRGQFKDVLFYREDVEKHAEKTYHPGDK